MRYQANKLGALRAIPVIAQDKPELFLQHMPAGRYFINVAINNVAGSRRLRYLMAGKNKKALSGWLNALKIL